MTPAGRELTGAEWDQLHAARGYVCDCPPDVALDTCERCTAAAEQLLGPYRDRVTRHLDQLRAETARVDAELLLQQIDTTAARLAELRADVEAHLEAAAVARTLTGRLAWLRATAGELAAGVAATLRGRS